MPELPAPNPEDLGTLLAYAVLAPSSHNTQPWHFAVDGRRVRLYGDRTRALPVNDPHDRELTISCGCALLNFRVAAARAGVGTKVSLLPDPDDPDLFAVVELRGEDLDETEAALFPAIVGRRTYRKRFGSQAVPDELLDELADAAEREGAWLSFARTGEGRLEFSALVSEGDEIQWDNKHWRRELAAWMHPRRRRDGLTVPGLVAPLAQAVVRTFDMGEGVGAKDRDLADESPVLAALGTAGDGPADWLHAGMALERVLLTGFQEGLQASYLNQPIQVDSLRPKLARLVGHEGHPQILLRLGFPTEEPPATPRRSLEDVVEYA